MTGFVPGVYEQTIADKQQGVPGSGVEPIVLFDDRDNCSYIVLCRLQDVALLVWRLDGLGDDPDSVVLVWAVGSKPEQITITEIVGGPWWILPVEETVSADHRIAYAPSGCRFSVLEYNALQMFKYSTSALLHRFIQSTEDIRCKQQATKGHRAAVLIKHFGPSWGWTAEQVEHAVASVNPTDPRRE